MSILISPNQNLCIMKQIIILLLIQVFFVTGFAQKNSVTCCSVIALRPGQPCCSVVTVRDNATGRTFEFTVDNSVAKNYTTGMALNAQPSLGIIKSAAGTVSKYVITEPANVTLCCGIISIVYGERPCCGIVSAKLPNDVRFSFSVPKAFAANLKIGQKVSIQHFGPVDGDKFQLVDGYAVVQSKVGALIVGKLATYSFRILNPNSNSNNDSTNEPGWDIKNKTAQRKEISDSPYIDRGTNGDIVRLTTNDKKWEIKQNLLAKGVTGKLFLNIPKDAECVITISQPVTERQVSYSINERSFSLVPGTFDVTISGSKVKDVPVQKGMDTRIKAGTLNVVASGTWTLYDEKKDRQVYYSTSAKKIGLPIGTYQMEINGTMQQILIKDGETVDF